LYIQYSKRSSEQRLFQSLTLESNKTRNIAMALDEEYVKINVETLRKTLGEMNPFILGKVNPEYEKLLKDALELLDKCGNFPKKTKIRLNLLKKKKKLHDFSEDKWNYDKTQFQVAMKENPQTYEKLKQQVKSMNKKEIPKHFSNRRLKVIFLDVDGVLNTGIGGPRRCHLERLKNIFEKNPDLYIVVSSSWRTSVIAMHWLLWSFQEVMGTTKMFIGCTSDILKGCRFRTTEIQIWLEEAKGADVVVFEYAALDDLPLMMQENADDILKGHFVRTKASIGLTEENVDKLKEVLKLS